MINKINFTSVKRNNMQASPAKKKPAQNDKKKALAIVSTLAAAGAMGVLIAAHIRRPKIQDIRTAAKNTQKAAAANNNAASAVLKIEDKTPAPLKIEDKLKEGVRIFEDSKTHLLDNVQIVEGKALKDGKEPFSGIFRTINKKGDDIAIEYKNGNMTNSHINGKLFKTYQTEKIYKLFREEGQDEAYTILKKIKQYDKDGEITKDVYLNYGQGDALKRLLTLDYENKRAFARDLSPEGKISVYSKYASAEQPWLIEQIHYGKDTNDILKEIKVTHRGPYKITDYKKGTQDYYYNLNPFTSGADETSILDMTPLEGWGNKKPLGKRISDRFHSIFKK